MYVFSPIFPYMDIYSKCHHNQVCKSHLTKTVYSRADLDVLVLVILSSGPRAPVERAVAIVVRLREKTGAVGSVIVLQQTGVPRGAGR